MTPAREVKRCALKPTLQRHERRFEITNDPQLASREDFGDLLGINVEVDKTFGCRGKALRITRNPIIVA